MRKSKKKILVTGGASFIGSEFVRQAVKKNYKIVIVDKLTYAGDKRRLKSVTGHFKFYKTDICNKPAILKIIKKEHPDAIINFAAESHVDRSIRDASAFITTNVVGTQILLDAAKHFKVSRFVHVSTDEVYGEIKRGQFTEKTPFNPNSPYSASKAAADLLVKSYIRTYKFPAIIVRPSNNYGPWQYPEKFVPVIIYKALNNQRIPVYDRGLNIREWLHISDCASAIMRVLEKGKLGEIYNIGSGNERQNIKVVQEILKILNKPKKLISYVQDRPGHDWRYSLNYNKISHELGWKPKVTFTKGMRETVEWYCKNYDWLEEKVSYLKDYWKTIYKPKKTRRSLIR